jgi:hypothetical protein
VFTAILVEFLFRLTLGIAAAMLITSSRLVTSGFFRVHLWVLLGMQTLVALAVTSLPSASEKAALVQRGQFWLAIAAAVFSYIGAVIWMYERRAAGKTAILLVAAAALAGCWLPLFRGGGDIFWFWLADRLSGGLLVGSVTTAMLLGHWYLNTPTMKLEPLKRLIVLIAVAIAIRMIVCGSGAWLEATSHLAATDLSPQSWALFVLLRWLAGLIGVLVMAVLTWQTLKIPNTQSATGILYAGVIRVFIGELTSQLLSAEARYPV